MPPHNLAIIDRTRRLDHVLRDLTEARRDLTEAEQSSDADATDREIEAEQRLEDRRDEFAEIFHSVTGLTFEQIRDAISEAVL